MMKVDVLLGATRYQRNQFLTGRRGISRSWHATVAVASRPALLKEIAGSGPMGANFSVLAGTDIATPSWPGLTPWALTSGFLASARDRRFNSGPSTQPVMAALVAATHLFWGGKKNVGGGGAHADERGK